MSGSPVILAFDQATRHCGCALIDVHTGLALGGAYDKSLRDNREAAAWVAGTVASCTYPIRLVAIEGTYLAPRGKNKDPRKDFAFKALDGLAELRGRILALLELRGLEIHVIPPWKWQHDLNLNFEKSEVVKAWSMKTAAGLLAPGVARDWLVEDSCDAVHIGRCARSTIVYVERQRSFFS